MDLAAYFPRRMRESFAKVSYEDLEEVRIRAGRAVELIYADRIERLTDTAEQRTVTSAYQTDTTKRQTGMTEQLSGMKGRKAGEAERWSDIIDRDDIAEMLSYLSGYSMYAFEEECRRGYFTVKGGHRIGIVGHVSSFGRRDTETVTVGGVYEIGGLNIRIAHEKKGCAKELIPWLFGENGMYHTFLLSPPGVGKTTYLRDCIRLISMGDSMREGLKVGVVDERSELAACYEGVPQNDLGPRTDVLDNCPKEQGIRMLLRSMSPQVIAVDELGQKEDFQAVFQAVFSGSRILGTVHAETVKELLSKPCCRELIEQEMIGRFVVLQKEKNGSRRFFVHDSKMRRLC